MLSYPYRRRMEAGLLLAAASVALSGIVALLLALSVIRSPEGEGRMVQISQYVRRGAAAFLRLEYARIAVFALMVAVVLFVMGLKVRGARPEAALTYLFGASLSASAGYAGMRIATMANVRTAKALEKGLHSGLKVAFSSGAVMGLTVVTLALGGILIVLLTLKNQFDLFAFSFGASSIALFARVGGGIYTKAADVGADLVGKVEVGIPEDDPRNPAVIADNVGDNVGDVAGMGADLYESYVASIVSAVALGTAISGSMTSGEALLPIIVAALGMLAAILGIFVVLGLRASDAQKAMNAGVYTATAVTIVVTLLAVRGMENWLGYWVSVLMGLLVGILIGWSSEYYTSYKYGPTRAIAESAVTGAATDIISGMAVGMKSTVVPVISIAAVTVLSHHLAGIYGIALAAVGMLSTLGVTLAMDSYGPVADNAAGIAEMAHLGKEIRERAEELDAVGNTTAAIGKGFAIGSAALTALALFVTYGQQIEEYLGHSILMELRSPEVVAGLFIGALMPFLFSSYALEAVGKAAWQMVEEVRRQFRERPGILEGREEPDYEACVSISTRAAIRKMILPSSLAILVPIAVGLALGPVAVGGLLAGAVSTGFLLAIYMANAGGAWDNAKKYIEAGNLGGKGSDAHKAAVVGDTVGDPLKDTAGPSLNILIKLMSIVSLLFSALFVAVAGW